MTRTHAIVAVVLLAVFLGAGYSILVGSDQPIGAPAGAPVATSVVPAAEEELICRAETAPATPEAEAAACAECPPGSPRCNQDRDCDKVCGGRVAGSCSRINSCIKCCLCAT